MPSIEHVPVHEGEVLDGKYRVDRVIGAGGMGVVVAATHVQLQTRVALKFLLPEVVSSPQIVERFVREARAAVQIQSEHVARVTDVGTLASGSPYMVMEFLEGNDLAEAVEKSGPMPFTQAVGYILQACEAMAEAHALGIVHRDLKPANLFLARRTGRDSIVKVLDFGISKTREHGNSSLTQTSAMMGSPCYMSPEQMKSSRDVDARADLWALGVILYELLVGEPPFVGETMPQIVCLVMQNDAPPLRDRRPDVPPGLADVVVRCLQRAPADRYGNIAELAAALVPFGPPRSEISLERIVRILGTRASMRAPEAAVALAEAGTDAKAPPMQATASAWANSHGAGRATRKRAITAVAGIVAAAVCALLVAVAWRMSGSRNQSAPVLLSGAAAAASSDAEVSLQPASAVPPESSRLVPDASAAGATSAVVPVSPTPATARATKALSRAVPAARKRAAPADKTPTSPTNRGLNMGMKE